MGFDVNIITNKKCSKEKCDNIVKAGATLWMAEELPNSKEFSDILQGVKSYANIFPMSIFREPVREFGQHDGTLRDYGAGDMGPV